MLLGWTTVELQTMRWAVFSRFTQRLVDESVNIYSNNERHYHLFGPQCHL